MSTLSDLYSKKRKYKNLKNDVNDIIDYLNDCINNINGASSKINNCYLIDGDSADDGKISTIESQLRQQRDILKNTIYPAITDKIRKLEKQIDLEESA